MSGEPCDLDNSPLIVESIGDISSKSYHQSSKENIYAKKGQVIDLK